MEEKWPGIHCSRSTQNLVNYYVVIAFSVSLSGYSGCLCDK